MTDLVDLGASADRHAVAVVRSDGSATSYGALDRAVDRAARALGEAGVCARHAVVVAAKDPWDFLVAALAAWRAGAVVAPADARAPEAVTRGLAARAGAAAVVTQLRPDGAPALDVAGDPREHDPRAALLLSTSGSSAAPKLVVLGRDGIRANVRAILGYLPVARAPRAAVLVPMSYSYGLVGQVLTTLTAGGTLLLFGDLAFATAQLDAMREHGAQGLSTVPSALRRLARAAEAPLPLDYVASAGAPLDEATVDLVRRAFGAPEIYNQYGLTEASPRVAALSDREPAFARGSVGRPLDRTEVFAVGEDGAPLPPGAEGELAVRGPSVMLGYLDDARATEQVLAPDGTLRTRDRGYVDASGYVFVAGRRDGVVKVAGERVSVVEIAAVLRGAEGVDDAAVVAVPHPELGATLTAFVEGDARAAASARARAVAELSPPKRPARVLRLESLPRTPNGKLALAELSRLAAEARTETQAETKGEP